MRKTIFTFLAILFTVSIGYSQVTTLWEKSAATTTLPGWFGTDFTRGLAFGNNHVYVVSRTGGSFVYIYNAATGDSIGMLRTDGISGGTYAVSDVEVSSNGVIFVCNLTTSASTSAFKIYKYVTEADSPLVAINYTGPVAARIGDKFTVTGSTADNSIVIWAASANTKELYKFTTTDNGTSFTANVVALPSLGSVALGSASVGPLSNGDFYYNAGGQNVQKFLADGSVIDTVSGGIVATGSNAIRFISALSGDEYFATFAFGTGNQNARIVKIPGAVIDSAKLFGVTTPLGANANGNGAGDVAVQKVSNYIYNIYVLATNNGFGAYQLDLRTQLAGDYYIGAAGTGPGGSDPEFATLRDAFEVLNNAAFTGDCNFYITSDILETFTPTVGYGLGLAINPEPYTVTFKPYTGVQPVVTLAYPTDGTSGPSGALIIGIPMDNNIAWNDLRVTKNIVIDGSNTVDGTTRDLTIECDTLANRNAFPLTIVGDVSNMVVKNTNIYYKAKGVSTSGNLFVSAVQVRSRNNLAVDYVPHDLMFENNHISANFNGVVQSAQGYGTYQSGTATATLPYNITLKNNLIEGKRRAITLYLAGSHDIISNEIILNQNIAASISNEAIYATTLLANSVVNIQDNKISKVSSMTNLAANGNTAISIETFGTYNIFNNMIYGFELTTANPVAYVRGIKNSSATATLNLNFNSIYMDNLADVGTGTVTYHGILLSNGTNQLANNIVVSAEPDFASYCIYRSGVAGTVTSNYNVFYAADATNGNVGFWDAAATKSLTDWQTASGQDANSVSKEVFFVSDTDLHLTGTSDGDFSLAGTPVTGITTDIDGDTRSTTYPYMGADEGTVKLSPPLELWTENFDYPAGDTLTNVGWKLSGTNTSNALIASSPGLTYPGYQSVAGNAVTMTTSGEDIFNDFTNLAPSSGSVYMAFMLNVTAAQTGDYFIALSAASSQTNYYDRIHIKSSGSGYVIGVSKSNEVSGGAVYGTTVLSFNTTYVIATKYVFNTSATTDDAISIFVINSEIPSTEPLAPEIDSYTNNTKNDASDLSIVTLRQGSTSAAPSLTIDGIRVAKSWSEIFPVYYLVSEDFESITASGDAIPGWSFNNAQTWDVSGYGHNSDKYAGWNETTNADHWITSPMVKDSIDLNFWLAAYNDAANLQVKVQVSSNGIDWTDEATFTSKGAGGDFGLDYVEKTVPIAKIGNYYIRWTTANYVEGGFYIDDVTVTPYTEPVNVGSDPMTVNKFELAQNYPNPFNPTTRINYSVPSDSKVTISIYSITGELVAELVNDNLSAGTYSVNFNGSNLASGMYIYRMVAGSFVQTHKMMLLK